MENVLVMMSSYNGERYIREQIDSILNQAGCKAELLVRDDGSTDSTVGILRDYEKKGKLTLYSGENLGPAKSFMHLLSHCKKKYSFYAFADQDDVWDRDKLAAAVRALNRIKERPAVYCSNSLLVDSRLKSMGVYVYPHKPKISLERVLLAGQIHGATMVFNRKLAMIFHERSVPEYVPMHDYYVSLICMCIGGKIIFDKRSYMKYRQHGSNVLGVDSALKGKIKRNLNIIFNSRKFKETEVISSQLLADKKLPLTENAVRLLELTSGYRSGIISRIKVAFLPGLRFGTPNQEICFRLAALLGNL